MKKMKLYQYMISLHFLSSITIYQVQQTLYPRVKRLLLASQQLAFGL